MRKTIVRTITATTIESSNLFFENGKPKATPNAPIVVNGVVTEEKAGKEVRKAYGHTAQVTNLASEDAVYEISVEDFIKYATKVDKPSEAQTEEGKTE